MNRPRAAIAFVAAFCFAACCIAQDKTCNVPLRQTSPAAADTPSWPFVTGIPIPLGALADPANARLLDANGREIPGNFQALAHWSPAKDSIKWLRVAFNAPAVAGQSPEYALQIGKQVRSTAVATPVKVSDAGDAIVVDAGAIVLTIAKKNGGGLASVTRAGRKVFEAAPADGPYVVDHTGAIFRSSLDLAPIIAVEEATPMRVVVRVEAWHVRDTSSDAPKDASPAGGRLNKSILRYYVYAGQPWVELHWTFIITADTDAVRFKDIGLKMTGAGKGKLGLEGGRTLDLAGGYLLQKKPDLYVVREAAQSGFAETAKGAKAPGWAANDSFALAMREFWQMYPKELEVRAGPNQGATEIILHAWPGHGEYNQDWFIEPDPQPGPETPIEQIAGPNGVKLTYDYFTQFQRFHHGPVLDFHLPDWWREPQVAGDPKKPGARYWLDPNMTGAGGHRPWGFFGIWSSALMPKGIVKELASGTSRTQELLLDFSGDDAAIVAARRSLFETRPHVWLKDPDWLDNSRALGPMNVGAAQLWLEPDAKGWELVEKSKHIGMWAYGNMPEWFNTDGGICIFRMIGCTGAHYGFFNTGWLLYMATGRPECLAHARANTLQWRDVEIVHYAQREWADLPDAPLLLGSSHTVSAYPWRYGTTAGFCGGVSALLFDYYLTGDLRSLEAAGLYVARATGNTGNYGVGNFGREPAGDLKTFLDWYAHSWDPAIGNRLDEIILRCVTHDPTTFRSKSHTTLNWTNWMPQYLELTRNPAVPLKHRGALKAFVLKWVEDDLDTDAFETGYGENPGNLLAVAWFETGNTKYLMPFVRNVVKRHVPPAKQLLIQPRAPGSSGMGLNRLDDALYAYAAWRDAVERKLIPGTEAELPPPAEIGYYRAPPRIGFKVVKALFLKEAGKELRVQCRSGYEEAGVPVTFYAPDGQKAAEAVTNLYVPVELVVPANAQSGIYRFEGQTSPEKRNLLIHTRNKHVVPVNDAADLAGLRDWYFMVPTGTQEFKAVLQPFNKGAVLLTPDLKPAPGPKAAGPFVVKVPAGADGKFWRFRPPEWDGWFVWTILQGVPPYVAIAPGLWFDPDAK